MAKKSSRSGSKKHYPVQRHFPLAQASPALPSSESEINIDRALSQTNHRLYRQSRVYKVKVSLDGTGAAAALTPGHGVDVYAIADTWMNQNAYKLAKEMFDENSSEELKQLGTSRARWNDFRVASGLANPAILFPMNAGAPLSDNENIAGEYENSEVTDAAGNAFTFRWSSSGGSTYNIIDEYDATGNTDATPSTPQTGVAYDGLTDEVDDNQMVHMSNDGNNPPYAASTLENNVFVRVGRLYIGPNGDGRLSTPFFNAPCGFVLLKYIGGANAATLNGLLHAEVQGGDYKGVKAPNYLE